MFDQIYFEKFRKANKLTIEIGKNLTAIAGQNGTMKSTLLACIGQPFGLGKSPEKEGISIEILKECTIVNKTFNTKINSIFKFSETFDKPGDHIFHIHFTNKLPENMRYENPLQVKSYGRSDSKNLRIVSGKNRGEGMGNIPIPVIYLGLSRLFPLGELDETNLKSENTKLTPKEENFLKKYYQIILGLVDENFTTIKQINKNGLRTSGISTSNYDWKTISAGQDNVSKIITTIIEFQRLKSKLDKKYYGGILLIDELECTLFPMAQKNLIKFLFEQSQGLNLKIVFTTHSEVILSELVTEKKCNTSCKINFLDNSFSGIINDTNLNLEEMRKNLFVEYETKEISLPKLNIYLEDEEASFFIKTLLPSSIKKYCNFIALSLGGNNIIAISEKIDEIKKSIVVLDKDMIGNKSIKNSKYKDFLFLPGDLSIEKDCITTLIALDKNDNFWKTTLSKQAFLQTLYKYDIELNNLNRDKVKIWFNTEKSYFGRNRKKLMDLFMEKYDKDVKEFQEKFLEKFKKFYQKKYNISLEL